MAKIRRLTTQLANQIAAGEVIERPSSAAKELAENSLDAGATRIDVFVGEGGRQLRVSDDGEGMSPEDAALAFERFATSKIATVDDLFQLRTLGFRGEALASIAAVARVELQTRRPGDDVGTRVRIVGGAEPEIGPVGCAEGTTIAVDDLFFNTPARLKFLKSPATETGHVVETLTALALANPRVAFTCRAGNRTPLNTTGARDLAEAAALVLGTEIGPKLLRAESESPAARVYGLVAPPELIRGDRAKQWLFINGRPVKHPALARAVDEAYSGHIPESRHPIYVLALTVDPLRVDFNVHPTKKEVRLADGAHLYSLVREAVGRALRQAPSVRRTLIVRHLDARPGQSQPLSPRQAMELYRPVARDARPEPHPERESPSSQETLPGRESIAGSQVHPGTESPSGLEPLSGLEAHAGPTARPWQGSPLQKTVGSSGPAGPESRMNPEDTGTVPGLPGATGGLAASPRETPQPGTTGSCTAGVEGAGEEGATAAPLDFMSHPGGREAFPWDNLRLLGQLHDTYLVLEHPDGLYLVDQHNSHERYLYEQLGPGRVPAQELLLPCDLDLSPDSAAALERHADGLGKLGFSVEPPSMEGGCWRLRAVPATLPAEVAEATLLAILEDLAGGADVPEADLANRWRVMLACHSAIKAGDRLTDDAMKRLLGQWRTCEQPFTCPHGRPTAVLYPLSELHRRCMRGMQTR